MARIVAENLTIEFPLYHAGARSLKKRILSATPLRLRTDNSNRIVVSALRDLSFAIEHGERVALVGPNGAGKTTLLRTLAGIYEPVAGRLTVEGVIGSLIDPSAGMDPDSTGRENIRLRAFYRGLDERQVEELTKEVVAFAGLGDFIDVPIRTYSAGMSVRLSFALATAMQPQILLMDEWLLAGDAEFMARAQTRLERIVTNAEILVIATHSMKIARTWCTRAIWLDSGRVTLDDDIEVVLPDPQAA